jgi:hypothetical protein
LSAKRASAKRRPQLFRVFVIICHVAGGSAVRAERSSSPKSWTAWSVSVQAAIAWER